MLTYGGLARRMIDLFWPIASEKTGFGHLDLPPIFLTLETAQYHMARIVCPLLDEGYFSSVVIDRNRLYSQIIDNLNKAAAVGFPFSELSDHLGSAWAGNKNQIRVFSDVQECTNRFRAYCLENNLLDFSLQLEVFWNVLWTEPIVQDHIKKSYQHLIYDNIEEDIPRAHDFIAEWFPDLASALIIYDQGGGYRQFLGADPRSALRLRDLCEDHFDSGSSFVMSPQIQSLAYELNLGLFSKIPPELMDPSENGQGQEIPISFPAGTRFFPQMIAWVVDEISNLIHEQKTPASEIAILAPYLSDSLRFSLVNRLELQNIPTRSHRPSRSLRDEPACQALLTLAALAHPSWNLPPNVFDLAYAFMFCIEELDLVRAQILANKVHHIKELSLATYESIQGDIQERISFRFGSRYSTIRNWIEFYQQGNVQPLDHFLRRLFGEVLSQPGFGFNRNIDATRVAASLIESIRKFRLVMDQPASDGSEQILEMGNEYIRLLRDGVLAAQYLEAWNQGPEEAVWIVPAYTFVMMNQPVTFQFWLDPGSSGWSERLQQPLTHPYVLSREWIDREPGQKSLWTDRDEVVANSEGLSRLVSGLLHRCKERIYLGISDLGESGFEQRGALLKAFQKVLQKGYPRI
jgi:hypothetical protein